jgi:hypothetical protein
MALQLTLEASVLQRETGRLADFLFVTTGGLEALNLGPPDALPSALGLELGVPIRSADELQDVLFASLSGRVAPFDEGSFDRWRPQRLVT